MADEQTSIFTNGNAFAVIKQDRTVVAWGRSGKGGSGVPVGLSGVKAIFSNAAAFAALKTDGTVVAWGDSGNGGSVPAGLSGVKAIASTEFVFAALKEDGTVVAWGRSDHGETNVPVGLSNVKTIYSARFAFAALKNDGTVVAWGRSDGGGNASSVQSSLTNVTAIYANRKAFAALKGDGSVVVWGHPAEGGTNPGNLTIVESIQASYYAFCARKIDNRLVTWGDSRYGGKAEGLADGPPQGIEATSVCSNGYGFAALKTDGTVASWGLYLGNNGGTNVPAGLGTVTKIYSTTGAFAALKTDGTVAAWGQPGNGGSGVPAGLGNVTKIYSTGGAFAALKTDNTVEAWGNSGNGGSGVPSGLSDIEAIYSNGSAFAALKTDGTVVAWGNSVNGGDASSVQNQLTNVKVISQGKRYYQGKFQVVTITIASITYGDSGDNTKPVITLVGQPSITVLQDTTYTDEGATASDDIDGDITGRIMTLNSVNTTSPGTYTVTYNVNDINGNAADQVTRTVTVIYVPPLPPSLICFPGNTPVHTDQGVINISEVRPGKHTIRGNEIEMVSQTRGIEEFLICIKKDAIATNVPSNDTYTTSEHRFYVKKQMISALMLEYYARKSYNPKVKKKIHKVPYNGEVLYNILLKDKHDYMQVNNLIAETLHPQNKFVRYYKKMKAETCSHKRKKLTENYNEHIETAKLTAKHNANVTR